MKRRTLNIGWVVVGVLALAAVGYALSPVYDQGALAGFAFGWTTAFLLATILEEIDGR